MSTRGDVVSRAALVEPEAIPEPWSASDDPEALAELLDRETFRRGGAVDSDGKGRLPDFLLDYENGPPVIPTTLQENHVRSSVATRWAANGDLVEVSADELRLQRDPKTGEVEGLLYEPKRTQELGSPTDITTTPWTTGSVTINGNAGSAKNQNYDAITEENESSNNFHEVVTNDPSSSTGDPVSLSVIAKSNGRDWLGLIAKLFSSQKGFSPNDEIYFNVNNGSVGGSNLKKSNLISASTDNLGNGWYRCNVSLKLDSAWRLSQYKIWLSKGDQNPSYTGDGSSGIYVMHTQAEVSREVTTPILQGGGVREADEVLYQFNSPDKTTGVAFSVFEGSDPSALASFGAGLTMGITPFGADKEHGVFMWEGGLLEQRGAPWPTWTTATRNSDESKPEDETIDRFEVREAGLGATVIVRQVAIHTQPHSVTQKTDLENNYLSTP